MELLFGVFLGMIYVITPGPVIIETLRRGWSQGMSAALLVQAGALIGDLIYAALALIGIGFVVEQPAFQLLLGFVGSGMLLYLGGTTLYQGRVGSLALLIQPHAGQDRPMQHQRYPCRRNFWIGLVLVIANPYGIAFWISMNTAILQNPSHHGPTFLIGFFLAAALVSLVIALLVNHSRARLSPRIFRLGSCGLGLLLIGFALALAYAMVLNS